MFHLSDLLLVFACLTFGYLAGARAPKRRFAKIANTPKTFTFQGRIFKVHEVYHVRR
jgi:hypothetical protein